jgi:hypothetical protein
LSEEAVEGPYEEEEEEEDEEEEEEDEEDISHLYPQPGDVIELPDGQRQLVLSSQIVPRGDAFGIDVRYTDGTMTILNHKKRHAECIAISGGLIDFWPPTGCRVIRDGNQILPAVIEENKWYQFWKWFS